MATIPERSLAQDHSRISSPLARLHKFIHGYITLEAVAFAVLFVLGYFWVGLFLDYGFFKAFGVDWVQQGAPWWLRGGILTAGIAALLALLAVRSLRLLFVQFSEPTLALVLERKFPHILGDRLITAVELTDPQEAAKYGYSPAMVRQTIAEAADRVGELPIKEVFDWKRLWKRARLLAILTVGLYFLGAGSFVAARSFTGDKKPMEGLGDFHDVATIWAERNILLRNVIWPRRAYLEILPWNADELGETGNFDSTGTAKVPQNTAPPDLRVRAWKYVVADESAEEGWRRMTYADLPAAEGHAAKLAEKWAKNGEGTQAVDDIELAVTGVPIAYDANASPRWKFVAAGSEEEERPLMWADLSKDRLGGVEVPGIPGAWDAKAVGAMFAAGAASLPGGLGGIEAAARILVGPKFISLSVDEVEAALEKAEAADKNAPGVAKVREAIDYLRGVVGMRAWLEAADAKATDRGNRRTMRKLEVPSRVVMVYSSRRETVTGDMQPSSENGYVGKFNPLKESVRLVVSGLDYATKARAINVVERPRIDKLSSDEERPAYLYYRPFTDKADESRTLTALDLRGKRQVVKEIELRLAGDATVAEVPMGTTTTITGVVTKPLTEVSVVVEEKDKKTYVGEKIEGPTGDEGRSFKLKIPNVTREQRFKVVFKDADGISAERKITVTPREDLSPRIRDFNPDETIRRGRGNEGYIISASARLPFKGRLADDHGLAKVRYGVKVIPADFVSEQKLRTMLGVGALPLFLSPGSRLGGTAYLSALTQELAGAAGTDAGPEQFVELPDFATQMGLAQTGEGGGQYLDKSRVTTLLASPQRDQFRKLYREYIVTPDRWIEKFGESEDDGPGRWSPAGDFTSTRSPLERELPVWQLTYRDKDGKDKPVRDPDTTKPQRRFILEVRLVAEDTYLDGELDPKTGLPVPHVGTSGETFTFVVVPENELLSRIAEEEEQKYGELQKAKKPLPENLDRLREASFSLSAGSGVTDSIAQGIVARCDTLIDALKASRQDAAGVTSTYERIIREMRYNQINDAMMTKVYRNILRPLRGVDRTFETTINQVTALRRAMDDNAVVLAERVKQSQPRADDAKKSLNELINQLNAILSAMEGLSKINELIQELARIERQEEDLETLVRRVLRDRIIKELNKDD